MCERDCTHSEGMTLPSGTELRVNRCPSGNACIQVGALAARYSQAELVTIGSGNDQRGILEVAREIRENPATIADGAMRPYDSLVSDK